MKRDISFFIKLVNSFDVSCGSKEMVKNFYILGGKLIVFEGESVKEYKITNNGIKFTTKVDYSKGEKRRNFILSKGIFKELSRICLKKDKIIIEPFELFHRENKKRERFELKELPNSYYSLRYCKTSGSVRYFILNESLYKIQKKAEKIFEFKKKNNIFVDISCIDNYLYIFIFDSLIRGTHVKIIDLYEYKMVKEYTLFPPVSTYDVLFNNFFVTYSSFNKGIKIYNLEFKEILKFKEKKGNATKRIFVEENNLYSVFYEDFGDSKILNGINYYKISELYI